MFSYISNIINYYGGNENADQENTDHQNADQENTDNKVCSNDIGSKDNIEITDKDITDEKPDSISVNTKSIDKKSINGKISSYFNNVGLIDDYIYFTLNVVIAEDQPRVGDDVIADISRSHSEGGWVATKVQIVNLWDTETDKNSTPYKDTLIGYVTDIVNYTASVKTDSYELPIKNNKFTNGYKPYKGDWVQIEIWHQPNKVGDVLCEDIISVSPLREKKIHATVTDIVKGYGFIDVDIFFPFTACERGYRVKKGDKVIAMVIESKQKRGEWRATSLSLKKSKIDQENMRETKTINNQVNNTISITENLDFGEVKIDENKKITVNISNGGNQNEIFQGIDVNNTNNNSIKFNLGPDVRQHVINGDRRSVQDVFAKGKLLCPFMTITPGEEKYVPIEFAAKFLGKSDIHIKFQFSRFNIERIVKAKVVDPTHVLATTSTPYEKFAPTFFGQKVNTRFNDSNIVPGQRPVRKRKTFLPNKLAHYPVPTYLKNCILNTECDIENVVPEVSQSLHISNYKRKLSTLLHIEELQMELEMRQFDMHCVLLRPIREFLQLEVPGLAEGRPSLLLGDRVVVTFTNKGGKSPSFEGFIHEIHADDILLKFSDDFHNTYRNDDLDVEFYFNRTPLRRCHQAVEHALNFGEEVLFPSNVTCKEPLVDITQAPITPFNVKLNKRQHVAVERILQASGRPIPYVLFGPPGTGKSVTVVEAILQIFSRIKHSRILACAPSNSAADLIAERLHQSGVITKRHMIRLNAFQRSLAALPEAIEQYCTNDIDNLKFVLRHRIVITTCNMAGLLYSFDLKVGHFTHIFVDEAGQATEAECLIPVGFAAGSEESQVVLAGDPYQLGPVLRSELSEEFGLNISFLERLTSTSLYERNESLYEEDGAYNPLVVTKLLNNYRSHEGLLKLSSSLFYNRELIPCADNSLVNSFVGMKMLPNPKVPFIFHGIRSEDYREGNSPSWFNPMEAVQVLKYVQTIVLSRRADVDDIGVITPYRKQVEKIRLLLDKCGLDGIKVGSVEEFQGQERKCIVLSTVRSNEELIDSDSYHNVGFLSNPKRFNVSITRAQALLVIVGNPIVLCYDAYWCAMLQYCVMNNCYTGCELPSLNQPLIQDNFRKAFQLLGIQNTNRNVDYQEDKDEIKTSEGNLGRCETEIENSKSSECFYGANDDNKIKSERLSSLIDNSGRENISHSCSTTSLNHNINETSKGSHGSIAIDSLIESLNETRKDQKTNQIHNSIISSNESSKEETICKPLASVDSFNGSLNSSTLDQSSKDVSSNLILNLNNKERISLEPSIPMSNSNKSLNNSKQEESRSTNSISNLNENSPIDKNEGSRSSNLSNNLDKDAAISKNETSISSSNSSYNMNNDSIGKSERSRNNDNIGKSERSRASSMNSFDGDQASMSPSQRTNALLQSIQFKKIQ